MFWNHRYRVTRTDNSYGFRDSPGSLDISNWSVIRYDSLSVWQYGSIDGLFVRATEIESWFLPGMKLTDFFEFIHSNEKKLEQFYIRAMSHHAPECFFCKGSGKIDWISRLTQVRRTKFIRSQDIICQYSLPKKVQLNYSKAFEKQYIVYPEIYLSKAKLEPCETWCHECKGTGVQLDGRLTIFKGYKGIKKRVKDYDSKEVHKRVLNLTNEKEA